MKLRPAILVCILCFVAGLSFASSVLIGSLTTVNNTTANSASSQIGSFLASPGTFSITNNGLSATSALTVNLQWSIDNSNWTNVATFNPPSTNAATYQWAPQVSAQPFWQRIQVVTTNNVQVGVIQN